MPKIIPIKDLKNTSEISELCHRSNEPIYITKNGYGDMVIMSMDIYENSIRQLNIYRELELSERQIQEGKTLDARVSLASMRERYGL
jgi:PHD/YefM family antitoxin component YafN of YafNO toxin-antitoxin module